MATEVVEVATIDAAMLVALASRMMEMSKRLMAISVASGGTAKVLVRSGMLVQIATSLRGSALELLDELPIELQVEIE